MIPSSGQWKTNARDVLPLPLPDAGESQHMPWGGEEVSFDIMIAADLKSAILYLGFTKGGKRRGEQESVVLDDPAWSCGWPPHMMLIFQWTV